MENRSFLSAQIPMKNLSHKTVTVMKERVMKDIEPDDIDTSETVTVVWEIR